MRKAKSLIDAEKKWIGKLVIYQGTIRRCLDVSDNSFDYEHNPDMDKRKGLKFTDYLELTSNLPSLWVDSFECTLYDGDEELPEYDDYFWIH